MKRIYLLLLLTFMSLQFACPLWVYSQPLITWQKLYPNPLGAYDFWGYDICPADGNNFYIISRPNFGPTISAVIKINAYGDTLWTKLIDTVGTLAGVSSGDGGCVVTGLGLQAPLYTIKLNSSGNIVWKKFYDLGAICYKIIRSSSNCFLACGNDMSDAFIMNIDTNGNIIWEKEYSAPFKKIYYSICQAYNNGYLVTGELRENEIDYGCGVVDRIDNSGNLIWEKEYVVCGRGTQLNSINQFNSGYILSGTAYDSCIDKNGICFIRIDTSGNTIMNKLLPDIDSTRSSVPFDLSVISPNKIIIPGCVTVIDTPPPYPSLIITDSSGNIIRSKIFMETEAGNFARAHVISNNDFVIIGNYTFNYRMDVFGIRTDTSLDIPPIGIRKLNKNFPSVFKLFQNYPNPFNPITKIKYDIPKEGFIAIKIFDLIGKEIYSINQYRLPGRYEMSFDGSKYASGVYFYRIEAADFISVKKMVLLK